MIIVMLIVIIYILLRTTVSVLIVFEKQIRGMVLDIGEILMNDTKKKGSSNPTTILTLMLMRQ